MPAAGALARDVQFPGDLDLGAALGEQLGGPLPTGLADGALLGGPGSGLLSAAIGRHYPACSPTSRPPSPQSERINSELFKSRVEVGGRRAGRCLEGSPAWATTADPAKVTVDHRHAALARISTTATSSGIGRVRLR